MKKVWDNETDNRSKLIKVILSYLKVNHISFIKTQNLFFLSSNGYLVYSYVGEEIDAFRIYVSVPSISALRKSFAFVIW